MEALEIFLNSHHDHITIYLRTSLEIHIEHKDFESYFQINYNNEKLFDLLKSIKGSVDLIIQDGFLFKVIYWCLKHLDISKVHADVTPCEPLIITKSKKCCWNIKFPDLMQDYVNEYTPVICASLSGYDVLIGVNIKRHRSYHTILFNFQIGKHQETYLYVITPDVRNIHIELRDEKLHVKHISQAIEEVKSYEICIYNFHCTKLDLLIVNATKGSHWHDFCFRGLYDPRLFLWIAAFCNAYFCHD